MDAKTTQNETDSPTAIVNRSAGGAALSNPPKGSHRLLNRRLTDGEAPLLLTLAEAARALGLSERKTWELGVTGEIPRIQIGRSVRFARGDIEDFIARQRRKAVQR